MGCADVLELEDSRRRGSVGAVFDPFDEGLHGNLGCRERLIAKHEAAEEAEVHAARQLRHRHEGWNRGEAAEEAGQAQASPGTDHGERSHDCAVADQLKHGVHASRVSIAYPLWKLWPFQLYFLRTKSFERFGPLRIACCGNDA